MRTREEQIKPSGWQFQDSEGNWADTTMPKWYQSEGYKVRPLYIEEAILKAERRAEQRVRAEIGRDSDRLDWLEDGCCDVRFRSEPIADTGDADTYCDIVEHHMREPKERVVGSSERLRAAIDEARGKK